MRPRIHDRKLTEKQEQFRKTISNPKLVPLLFSEAASFEEQWHKEVVDFTKEEALEFLKSLNSLSLQSLIVYTWTMRKYAEFCGINSSEWNQISREDCEALIDKNQRKRKYLSESHVKALTAVLFNPVDRFILRGFYDGLCGDFYGDFMGLYPESFNQDELTVRLSDGNVKHISQELYDAAMESAETYIYIPYGVNATERKLYDWTLGKQDIVKFTNGSERCPTMSTWSRKIRGRLEHIRRYFGISYLNIPNLRRSGVYNHLLGLSEEKDVSVKRAVYLPEFEEVADAYGLNKSRLDAIAYRFSTEEYN